MKTHREHCLQGQELGDKVLQNKLVHHINSVTNDTLSDIETIFKQCGPFTSPGTRYNGLPVLRKIGTPVILSRDTLAHEVRKSFHWDTSLYEGMLSILHAMDRKKRQDIRYDNGSTEGL